MTAYIAYTKFYIYKEIKVNNDDSARRELETNVGTDAHICPKEGAIAK